MKGTKLPKNNKALINNHKKNNDISPHLNVLQFDLNNNNHNNINKMNNNIKKVRNLSQKPIRKINNNYYINNINNNFYNYNDNMNNMSNIPQNNFMIKNSYRQNYNNSNQNNNYNFNNIIPKKEKRNSQKQLLPIKSNQNSNKNNKKKKQNNNNQNENIKIKLDQKGVYISQEDDIFEDQNDPVNKLNTALKYKQSNNLRISQEEKNMIDTIKKVSSNRVQYRNTHQMIKEIGKIMKNPVVSFLIHKEPVEKNEVDNPSDKLSQMLSEKMLEEKKKRMREEELIKEKKEEDLYYEELQKKIKEEIKNKGNFDFSKLPDKDRQMLAQRKVYNKIGLKVYENYADDKNNNNNKNDNINDDKLVKNNDINEKIENQIKNEINREEKRENFLKEIERYNEEEDDYFNIDKIKNKKKEDINEYDNNNEKEKEKEKPTDRGILEKILKKIEYKNEQLINHNEANDAIYAKKDKNTQKKTKNF